VDPERDAFLKANNPKRFDEVTNEWVGKLVGAEVESFATKLLEDGAMSDAAAITPV